MRGLIATACVKIKASGSEVWNALVNSEIIRQYFFGTEVVSDWKEGRPIVWKGVWDGRTYEDRGVILRMEKGKTLSFTHYSPLSGNADLPENYHTVIYKLSEEDDSVIVSLSQDNNATEKDRDHSQKNWEMVLGGLKKLLEK
jgi:uncharacterized protein YndB with AHSA1/START domain